MQERLWLTDPRRATCLAKVLDVRRDWFAVDRCLFAPRSRATRHPQNPDEGLVIHGGDKRIVSGVIEDFGLVWLRLRGAVPQVGDTLNCQLDQDVRLKASRAHTAMHLVLAQLLAARAPPMVADPEVKGGGHFRIQLGGHLEAEALAKVLAAANAAAAKDLQVGRTFEPKDVVKLVCQRQDFQPPDPYPGGDVAPVVRIGEALAHPCDGTHVERTGKVGRIVFAQVSRRRDGMLLVGKVRDH